MTNLTEQEVCIGSLGQQKVYLYWSDVKDICTNAVSKAYEQAREENAQLKAVLKECYLINEMSIHTFNWLETIVTPSQKYICPKVVGGINKTQQSIKQALGEE